MPDADDLLQEFATRNVLTFSDQVLFAHGPYPSFPPRNEHADLDWEDNERLEYLGDAVLDFLLAEYLLPSFPNASEGELTALRAALVRRETLARLAHILGIGPALFMVRFAEVETGGRERDGLTLCVGFEALVGALYLDQGQQAVSGWVLPMMERNWPAPASRSRTKTPRAVSRKWRRAPWGSRRVTGR